MYEDVSNHLYDIPIMMRNDDIKKLLKNKFELNKLIGYKRKEEQSRLGGIPESKEITNFNYMKIEFNDDLKNTIKKLSEIFESL